MQLPVFFPLPLLEAAGLAGWLASLVTADRSFLTGLLLLLLTIPPLLLLLAILSWSWVYRSEPTWVTTHAQFSQHSEDF